MIHQGEIIEKVVRRSGISITELSRRMKVHRRSIYNWFNQPRLSIYLVAQIGDVLQYDFSKDFPDYSFKDLPGQASPSKAGADSPEYWESKYLDLLERYNDLLIKTQKHLLEDVA